MLKIQDWTCQWKMLFNPGWTKQTQELIFLIETNISGKPSIYFNNATVEQTPVQKHLSINCDSKLLFNNIINDKLNKAKKSIYHLHKLQLTLPISAYLLIINLSKELIWTVVMSFMISPNKLNQSNIVLL